MKALLPVLLMQLVEPSARGPDAPCPDDWLPPITVEYGSETNPHGPLITGRTAPERPEWRRSFEERPKKLFVQCLREKV